MILVKTGLNKLLHKYTYARTGVSLCIYNLSISIELNLIKLIFPLVKKNLLFFLTFCSKKNNKLLRIKFLNSKNDKC